MLPDAGLHFGVITSCGHYFLGALYLCSSLNAGVEYVGSAMLSWDCLTGEVMLDFGAEVTIIF